MQIKLGYEIVCNCSQPTPMILMANIHYSHAADIVAADRLTTEPAVPVTGHRDVYGNWCSRIVAPIGRIRIECQRGRKSYGRTGRAGSFRPATPGERSARRYFGFSARQPLLQDGSDVTGGVLLHAPRMEES